MFSQEKMPVNDFIIDVLQQLGDEQDLELDVIEKKSPLRLHILHTPHSVTGKIPFLTTDELGTFISAAVGRMRDLYPDYNWTSGLRFEVETLGFLIISVDEDKLAI